MSVQDYIVFFRRRFWIIFLTLIVTVSVVTVGTLLITPIYEASAKLHLATAPRGSIDWVDYNITYADRLMNTYRDMATTTPTMDALRSQLGTDDIPKIRVNILANSELIEISAQDENPEMAARAADIVAQELIARGVELSSGRTIRESLDERLAQIEIELANARNEYNELLSSDTQDAERLVAINRTIEAKRDLYNTLLTDREQARLRETVELSRLSIIEQATVPSKPVKPNKTLNITLGLLAGLIGGLGLAFLFESFDTRLYSVGRIETLTDMSTLATIPEIAKPEDYMIMNGSSVQGEAFRRLRTKLMLLAQNASLRSIVITSGRSGEGKSTIVASLGLALSHAGLKVVVVDCDLRRPTLHKIFGVSNDIGLRSVLLKGHPILAAIQRSVSAPQLAVLTSETKLLPIKVSGAVNDLEKLSSNEADILDSEQMRTVLDELEKDFDLVLLDTPAYLEVTDAAILTPLVDGVVLVVSRAQTTEEAIQLMRTELQQSGAKLVGTVINRATALPNTYY